MAGFPTSPTDGQVYIKDGVRYVYSSASNSWDIQTDPNKVAGNIKNGVAIDNITGNYDHEATNPITASSMLSGKVGFVNGNKITGTGDANLVASNIKNGVNIFNITGNYVGEIMSNLQTASDGNFRIDYYYIGKYYIIAGLYDIVSNPTIKLPAYFDASTVGWITSILGISSDTNFYNTDNSATVKTCRYVGGILQYGSNGGAWLTMIKAI